MIGRKGCWHRSEQVLKCPYVIALLLERRMSPSRWLYARRNHNISLDESKADRDLISNLLTRDEGRASLNNQIKFVDCDMIPWSRGSDLFLDAMSLNIKLPRLNSATNRFSFALPCSSSFGRFALSIYNPTYPRANESTSTPRSKRPCPPAVVTPFATATSIRRRFPACSA